MSDTVVPVAGSVNGNITDCKYETVQKSVDRAGAFSFTQTEHYLTYDVCTKKTIAEYTTKTVTGGGILMIFIIFGVIFTVVAGIAAGMDW